MNLQELPAVATRRRSKLEEGNLLRKAAQLGTTVVSRTSHPPRKRPKPIVGQQSPSTVPPQALTGHSTSNAHVGSALVVPIASFSMQQDSMSTVSIENEDVPMSRASNVIEMGMAQVEEKSCPEFQDDGEEEDESDIFVQEDFASTLSWSTATVKGGLPPSPRCWAAVCAVKENFVVMGGYDTTTPYPNDLHVFNTETKVWSKKSFAPTEMPRYAHTLDYVNNKLIVFGGDSISGYLNDLYIVSNDFKSSEKVEPKGAIPQARAAPATAVIGNSVYFFGGDSGTEGGYQDDLHYLDSETMSWHEVKPKNKGPEARGWHTMSAVGKKLFVFGGYNGNSPFNDLWEFDTETLKWTQPEILGTAPTPRYSHATVVYGKYLIVLGGVGRTNYNNVYVFSTETYTWLQPTMTGSVPPEMHGHSAVLMTNGSNSGHGNIFVFGGYNLQEVFDTFSVVSMEPKPSIKMPTVKLSQELLSLVNQKEFSDVIFNVQGQSLYAHKAIICARSKYFNAMFRSFSERSQSEIMVPNVRPEIFILILEYLYTGSTSISSSVVSELLQSAGMYNMKPLLRMCECTLERTMDIHNAARLYEFACFYHAKALMSASKVFIVNNLDVISKTPVYRALSDDTKKMFSEMEALQKQKQQELEEELKPSRKRKFDTEEDEDDEPEPEDNDAEDESTTTSIS